MAALKSARRLNVYALYAPDFVTYLKRGTSLTFSTLRELLSLRILLFAAASNLIFFSWSFSARLAACCYYF